jgi:hypothetical protein
MSEDADPQRRAVLAAGAVAALAATTARAEAQTPPSGPVTPTLTHVATLYVTIAPMEIMGEIAAGQGRVIPITGGDVEGPKVKGKVIPGGADWQTQRADGVLELNAHYGIKTDDGVIIEVKNHVLVRTDAPAVDGQPAKRMVRGAVTFVAPKGKHDWLNKSVFVSTLNAPGDPRAPVVIRVFEAG